MKELSRADMVKCPSCGRKQRVYIKDAQVYCPCKSRRSARYERTLTRMVADERAESEAA